MRTRLGFTGTMAAYSTFAPKAEVSFGTQVPRASRYRTVYRVTGVIRGLLLALLGT